MIIKYAYAYANPTGTYYVGLRDGVVTHQISAVAMAKLASEDGGALGFLRRWIVEKIGDHELFELCNVTPYKITERGIVAAEEITELRDVVKFDPNLETALKSFAKQVHEEFEKARNPLEEVRAHFQKLVREDIIVEAKVDEKNPQVVNVMLKIPMEYIEISLPGGTDGTNGRS
jgi:hypothetical protein